MKTMKTLLSASCVAAIAIGFCIAAEAQTPIDETRSVNSDATIHISNISGSVNVTGWDRKEVHVTGTLGKKVERLEIDGDEKRLGIEVIYPDRVRNIGDTHLEVRLPKGCRVEVSVVSADVSVDKVEHKLYVESVSGDIEIDGKLAEVDVESVSGEIEVRAETPRLSIESVSSDVQLEKAHGDVMHMLLQILEEQQSQDIFSVYR